MKNNTNNAERLHVSDKYIARLKHYQSQIVQFVNSKVKSPVDTTITWCCNHACLMVCVLLLAGMGLRIGYRFMVERPERDEVTYVSAIQRVAYSGGDTKNSDSSAVAMNGSALIAVGVMLTNLGINTELGLRVFNFICSFFWLCMIYFLGKALFSSTLGGIVCLWLAAFNPYAIRMAGYVMREPFYLLTLSAGVFCGLQLIRNRNCFLSAGLLGFLCVIGYWSRYEGVEMLMLFPVALILHCISAYRSGTLVCSQWRAVGSMCGIYLITLGFAGSMLYVVFPEHFSLFKTKISWIRAGY